MFFVLLFCYCIILTVISGASLIIITGVFQLVHGGVDVVNAMCDNDDMVALSFVGSSKVAEIVSKRCHAKNKRVLALGKLDFFHRTFLHTDCNMYLLLRVFVYALCCDVHIVCNGVMLLVGAVCLHHTY